MRRALQGGAGESRGQPCRSTDPLFGLQATACSHRRGVCLEILPCEAARACCNKRVQFSSGLNYLIDIENTVIAMSRLRLRTYDEVAATKIERTDIAALPRSATGLIAPQRDCPAGNTLGGSRSRAPARQRPAYHSITSSASASSLSGASRPSVLANLRLIAMSNLVDCTTGRSAGFSPLRIRPA